MGNKFILDHLNDTGKEEFDKYVERSGIFSKLFNKCDLDDPFVFWSMAETYVPVLGKFVIKLMQIPASTAELERLFSHWSYVHSLIRNRLLTLR